MSYLQEIYFADGIIERTEFKDYSDWYYNHDKTRGITQGPIGYDGEGGAYQTIAFIEGAEGIAVFDEQNVVCFHSGTIGGENTRLIFDYTHLPLWRKIYANEPDRLEKYDEIEKEYNEKIKGKRNN